MGCRKQGMLPEPRLHKRGYLRLRVNGQEFVLGQPGSRQADERHKAILAAWGAGGSRLPDDFKIESNPKKQKHSTQSSILPTCTKSVWQIYSVQHLQTLRKNHGVGIYCGVLRFV